MHPGLLPDNTGRQTYSHGVMMRLLRAGEKSGVEGEIGSTLSSNPERVRQCALGYNRPTRGADKYERLVGFGLLSGTLEMIFHFFQCVEDRDLGHTGKKPGLYPRFLPPKKIRPYPALVFGLTRSLSFSIYIETGGGN